MKWVKKIKWQRFSGASLKVKWSATVGLAIFITLVLFSIIITSSISSILMNKEMQSVTETALVVQQRLQRRNAALDKKYVKNQLDVNGQAVKTIYQDTVLMSLAQKDMSVTVYDAQKNLIFSSKKNHQKFQGSPEDKVLRQTIKGKTHLVGSQPIIVKNKTLGYIQVVKTTKDYDHSMDELRMIMIVIICFALLFSLLIGYLLAEHFLKPIRLMKETIEVINQEPNTAVRIPERKSSRDEVAQLIVEFNEMLNRIQHYFQQQDQFVSDVSHELRTPVAIIEGHLKLLNRWGKDDPEVLEESLKASLQEILRMKNLIQEMLDLTRADQVITRGTDEITNVGEVVIQSYHNFEMLYPDFQFIMDDDLYKTAMVNIDHNHLEQIMIILLDNAIKYSTTRQEVHISVARDTRYAQIVVQDFGEGISDEDKKRVFHRFYRVDKARSRQKGGNGLGLAIAQQLIEGYSGTISVESSLGHGSIFKIELPLIEEKETENENNPNKKDV